MTPDDVKGLYTQLEHRGMFKVLRDTITDAQLRLMGRVTRDNFDRWSLVMQSLLKAASTPNCPWSCDISKQYVLDNTTLRFGWRLIFQAQALVDHLPAIQQAIVGAPPVMREVESILLPGYQEGQEREGNAETGRGAWSALRPPLAATRGRR